MKRYALIGKNIQDSLSPVIHSAYGCQYDLLDVKESELEEVLKLPYDGFNVTAPYKEKVKKYLDAVADESLPVNTISTDIHSRLVGHNTDKQGFSSALNMAGVILYGKIGIIGNGAMARLIKNLHENSILINGYDFSPSSLDKFDALINCTPRQDYNLSWLPRGAWVMDLGYKDSTFIDNARASGNFAFNGMGMLMAQAKGSRKIWKED